MEIKKLSEDPYFQGTWLQKFVPTKCPACGADLHTVVYGDSNIPHIVCSNGAACPGSRAAYIDFIATILGISGVGPSTAFAIGMRHPELCPAAALLSERQAPQPISAINLLRILCIKGKDSIWQQIVPRKHIRTIKEFADFMKSDPELVPYIPNVIQIADYAPFDLPDEPPVEISEHHVVFNVMITGTPRGFATKEAFVDTMNERYGKYVTTIHCPHKRKTGVQACIWEQGSAITGKYNTACESGIPILGAELYEQTLKQLCEERSKHVTT